MPIGTPFHDRTFPLCESLNYREWSGCYTVSAYESHHEHEYNAIRNAAALGPEGTRVNAISAGPIKTLAAAGISGFSKILHFVERTAPLRRNVTIDEVGNVAAFYFSPMSSAITGEVTHVDCGFSNVAAGLGE